MLVNFPNLYAPFHAPNYNMLPVATKLYSANEKFYSKHKHQKHDPHIPCKAGVEVTRYSLCKRRFGNRKAMERHLWTDHPDFALNPQNSVTIQSGVCPICQEQFSRRDNCKRHIDEQHLDIKRS